ncbi:MAG: hypothetical protein P8R35_00630 [Planctomycetota bacterium]|nr:hypothetical protein [Planctomycetota bacterium]
MKCNSAVDLLPLYVGDDLGNSATDQALTRQLEEHIDSCKLCEAEYSAYADARGVLLDVKGEIGSAHLESLWSEIDAQLPPAAKAWPRQVLMLAVGFAASLLVILIRPSTGQDLASEGANSGLAVSDIHIPDNLKDIEPPTKLVVQQNTRLMSSNEVASYYEEQRQVNNALFHEQSLIMPDFNQRNAPAASLVGVQYPTSKDL